MSQVTPEKYLLIDCDPGVDDCLAIMMALSCHPRVKTLGITCVMGNVGVEQVTMNAMRVVKLYDMVDEVPVFKGCSEPIIPPPKALDSTHYHGNDGFGDAPHVEPKADKSLLDLVQKEHAVDAIIRFSKEYEGKLQIAAIGPLTNLALAAKIDPDVPKRLKSLHILGGTYKGHGNITPLAEFNFYADPEAANITLNNYSLHCAVQLISYETTNEHAVPVEWFHECITNGKTKKSKFYQQIFEKSFQCELQLGRENKTEGIIICDTYLIFAVLHPQSIIKSRPVRVWVELGGFLSRGGLIIDHRNIGSQYLTKNPIELVEKLDNSAYMSAVSAALVDH